MGNPEAEFDEFSENYEEALQKGISLSGEGIDYFAEARVRHLSERLSGRARHRILDFGCGTGAATPFLLGLEGVGQLVGFDPSSRSIDVARRRWRDPAAQFVSSQEGLEPESMDLAFCNGVFHHIPVPERLEACRSIHRTLRPGGVFAFWENNPWNPGTRWVMSRIPFDRDAITLSPPESRRLLRSAGFEVLGTDFLFFFPKPLAFLRFLDPLLRPVPMGAQYLVLAAKPA